MAENVGSIEYDSRITTDKLRKDAAEVDRLSKKAGDDLESHTTRGSGRAGEALQKFGRVAAVALAASGAAVAAFGLTSAKAFIESENAIAQTEAVLKSTGGAAGVTAKEITKMANALQRETRYSDETIRSAQNMLLTFTNIGKKTFPGATQAVLDMATAMGTDLKSTAIQVGKALQDPVLGATALQRVGVRLTQSQKDLIKSLVDSGDAAGAQAVILKELQTEFGGSAKAAGETFAGRLDILKNQLGEVQEGVGSLILKGLSPLVKNLLGAYDAAGGVDGILKTLGKTLKPVVDNVKETANQVGNYLLPKLIPLVQTIKNDLIPSVVNFAKAFGSEAGTGLVAALGFAITALNILLAVASPVIQYMSDNTWIVWGMVAAFAAIKTALIIDKAVTAFTAGLAVARGAIALTTGTAGTATTALGIMRGALVALQNPWIVSLTIVGVALVLAGIKEVADKLDELFKKWTKAGDVGLPNSKIKVSGSSDIGLTQRLMNAFSGFRAGGGTVKAGQSYIVGENQPELFVPRTSGTIIPEVPMGRSGGSNVTINLNMSGIMARSKSDERDIAKSLVRRINEELSAKGQPVIAGGVV